MVLHKGRSLFGDLFLYYHLVLTERRLNLFVCELPLLNLDLALVLEGVDLHEQHFATGLLLLVHLVRA